MTYFRTDNTEGFSDSDLRDLNDALDGLALDFPGLDDKTLGDALTNAWTGEQNVFDLVEAAHSSFRA